MMDALEELKKALASCLEFKKIHQGIDSQVAAVARLGVEAMRFLPPLIAELEARRAQDGDIPNAAGFTPRATLELK